MSGLTPFNPHQGSTSSLEQDDLIEIGQWYWVKEVVRWDGEWKNDDGTSMDKGEEVKWLGCVMKIGSNYIELQSPPKDGSSRNVRVHFRDFWNELEFEPDAAQHIAAQTKFYREKVSRLLGQVKEVTARLGVVPQQSIAQQSAEGPNNSLAVIAQQVDTNAYKNALVKAKEETLPELFKQIEDAHKGLAKWMMAETLPTKATIGPMKDSIGMVEDRIYTISLYAGLTEDAVKCCDGDPAGMTEKLRVMQRRLYMDEECIANYTAGGIDFESIREFDEWISLPENRDRLLPFPRTLAAFRVRRNDKEREDGGSIKKIFVNIALKDADKFTYLYVRNGEQVWRIVCDFEFDEMIFPDSTIFDPNRPMMVKMFANRVDKMITRHEWEVRKAEEDEQSRLYEDWKDANPKASWIDNPYRNSVGFHHEMDDYQPFDDSNVYYDEAMKKLAEDVKRYNRVAVIIQGLFDRSLVLHPHPPVQIWSESGFNTAIELIRDASTLTHGDKPDFETYRAKLNASMGPESIVVGQQDFWLRAMAERENEKQARDWRSDRQRSNYTRYKPYGNPGPRFIGKPDEWKPRSKAAVFRWNKEPNWSGVEGRPSSITVPADELLNVSAYTPGDYKQFFNDPRTRQEYLKWAPLLLAAEDWHAGITRDAEAETDYNW
jgi:hypothetical protein